MTESQRQSDWATGLMSILSAFTDGRWILVLRNLLGTLELVEQFRDRVSYHGMYEILDYQSTLDIQDATDDAATIVRHGVIRFLQDNVVAIHEHA